MSLETVTADADRLLGASVALQRIAAAIPRQAQIMRGSFYGAAGPELEIQLALVEHVAATAEVLQCGLVHERHESFRTEVTKRLLRRHLWIGHVNDTRVTLWAFEVVDELPMPVAVASEQGARFPAPAMAVAPAGDGAASCEAPAQALSQALLVAV